MRGGAPDRTPTPPERDELNYEKADIAFDGTRLAIAGNGFTPFAAVWSGPELDFLATYHHSLDDNRASASAGGRSCLLRRISRNITLIPFSLSIISHYSRKAPLRILEDAGEIRRAIQVLSDRYAPLEPPERRDAVIDREVAQGHRVGVAAVPAHRQDPGGPGLQQGLGVRRGEKLLAAAHFFASYHGPDMAFDGTRLAIAGNGINRFRGPCGMGRGGAVQLCQETFQGEPSSAGPQQGLHLYNLFQGEDFVVISTSYSYLHYVSRSTVLENGQVVWESYQEPLPSSPVGAFQGEPSLAGPQ